MYQIRCVVSDNKLRDALNALKGITLEQPIVEDAGEMPRNETYRQPQKAPVANGSFPIIRQRRKYARKSTPYTRSPNKVEGGVEKVIRDLIARSGVEQISAREMRDETYRHGYRPGAYSHAVRKLMKDGTLAPDGDLHGGYKVMKREASDVV